MTVSKTVGYCWRMPLGECFIRLGTNRIDVMSSSTPRNQVILGFKWLIEAFSKAKREVRQRYPVVLESDEQVGGVIMTLRFHFRRRVGTAGDPPFDEGRSGRGLSARDLHRQHLKPPSCSRSSSSKAPTERSLPIVSPGFRLIRFAFPAVSSVKACR